MNKEEAMNKLAPDAVERLAAANMLPIDREIEARDLPVRGEIPQAIRGVLFRNGPNRQFPPEPGQQSHWFTGDGMLHRFEIEDGRVSYKNRWVRTLRFHEQASAGRNLRQAGLVGASDLRDSSANTNIVWHGGRLMALEESHWPYVVQPGTLETVGCTDLDGVLKAPFTAHPHIDPVTGELFFFGCNADGPFTSRMTVGRISPQGKVTHYESFDAPYTAFVHDFVVTAKYIVIPVQPLTARRERIARGRIPLAWEPEVGSHYGVMPRNGSVKDLRWIKADPCYVYHFMNAWDEGELIKVDGMQFAQPSLFPNADDTPVDPSRQRAVLTRWTIDPVKGTFRSEALDDLSSEFPRVDDRFATQPYRHGWYSCSAPGRTGGLDAISHMDHATGKRSTFALPVGDVPSEPIFVPASADAQEGDGWILSVIWRAPTESSELVVLDARNVQDGPIATVPLPQRVPFGFHGNFVAAPQ